MAGVYHRLFMQVAGVIPMSCALPSGRGIWRGAHTLQIGFARDPSLRLKNGSNQDAAVARHRAKAKEIRKPRTTLRDAKISVFHPVP